MFRYFCRCGERHAMSDSQVIYMIGFSLIIQLATITCALQLIAVTGWKKAWILLSLGITTMGIRRAMTFAELLAGEPVQPHQLSYEIFGLGGSALMLLGVILIKPIFLSLKNVEKLQAEAIRDKDMLMKETYHRVKNNLSVIQSLMSLQLKDIKDENYKAYFVDIQNRVKSMSMIHERLQRSGDLKNIDAGEYLRSLSSTLFHGYRTNPNIRISHEIEDASMDVDTLIPLGLILNELVSNAMKYAFPAGREGEVRVSFSKPGEQEYLLVVKDDGAGLPPDFDIRQAGSLGMRIVKSLARQLNAELSISGENGAEFRLLVRGRPHP